MKKLMRWGVLGLTTAAVALAGCGSGNGDNNVSLRIANATLTHSSVDLYVNGTAVETGTTTDMVSGYASPGSGANTLQVNDTTTGAALAVSAPSLTGGGHYTLIAYESNGAVKSVVLPEDYAAPTSGNGQLRIYNAAPDAGKLDVYVTGPNDSLATASPAASFTTGVVPAATVLLTYPVGTYRVRVTANGSKTDLRMDMPAVALANQQIGTVIMTPTTGGSLLNGSLLLQQSTYTAVRNANTRVRLASAAAGGASVAATATAPATAAVGAVACTGTGNTCTIDSGSVSPAFGFYALVPAGSTVNATVNGASVASPTTALVAGADQTLLVYTGTAATTASLLTDDNHLPSDSTTTKLSLINAVTGAAGNLTLTANSSLVAQNIAPGVESTAAQVPSSTAAMNLKVTSSTVSGTFLQDATNTLNANSTYTVMIGGAAGGTPQLLLH